MIWPRSAEPSEPTESFVRSSQRRPAGKWGAHQYERTPGLAAQSGTDESSLLLVADPRGGNLQFQRRGCFFLDAPDVLGELQTRFGNQYYVKDNGEDGAVLDAPNAVEICLERGGRQVVPGLPPSSGC